MYLDPKEFSWQYDENLVTFPHYPWAYPNKQIRLFLPEPYGPDDYVTEEIRALLVALRAHYFHLPHICLETRFQVLNGQSGHWVTDVWGTGSSLRNRRFEFRLEELGGRAVVRLTRVTSPTMTAQAVEGRWEVSLAQKGGRPLGDPLMRAVDFFKATFAMLPEERLAPSLFETSLLDILSPSGGDHGYKIFQVAGKGVFAHTPIIHLEVLARRWQWCHGGWRWPTGGFYKKDMNVNCAFFWSQADLRETGWFRKIADVLLPPWQHIYYYPCGDKKWPARMIRDRKPELTRLRGEGYSSVCEVLVPFPLPAEGKLCLDRRGTWYPPGH